MLSTKKDYAQALGELNRAAELQPSNAYAHEYYAQALLASGNSAARGERVPADCRAVAGSDSGDDRIGGGSGKERRLGGGD